MSIIFVNVIKWMEEENNRISCKDYLKFYIVDRKSLSVLKVKL